MSINLSLMLAFLFATTAFADDTPPVVSRDKLAFLGQQQEPLSLEMVRKRMGGTTPGRGPDGKPTFAGSRNVPSGTGLAAMMDPYFGYQIRERDTFIEFWMRDDPIEKEPTIFMVVERSPAKKRRIIWPKRLIGTDPYEMMKKEWPKMYK